MSFVFARRLLRIFNDFMTKTTGLHYPCISSNSSKNSFAYTSMKFVVSWRFSSSIVSRQMQIFLDNPVLGCYEMIWIIVEIYTRNQNYIRSPLVFFISSHQRMHLWSYIAILNFKELLTLFTENLSAVSSWSLCCQIMKEWSIIVTTVWYCWW